ncbi:MAG TPA: MFS transporter [bacterium]|nr:MFS transporter [bacterium]
MTDQAPQGGFKAIVRELTQPFIDLGKTSRALFGVNLTSMLEGLTYFGVLTLLAIFFNESMGLDDVTAGRTIGILTAGITIAMMFLGATVDWIGIRKTLIISLILMAVGRAIVTLAPSLGASGPWASAHWIALFGILFLILGYGIYQPALYAGVKRFTNAKTSAMGYAMLYALMNLGGFLPGIISPPLRKAFEIKGVFWFYVAITVLEVILIAVIMSKRAIAAAEAQAAADDAPADGSPVVDEPDEMAGKSVKERFIYYIKHFPFTDLRFMYFIFILIPVQTLFAHNWLTIPQYTSRAFDGMVSENFEFFSNLNPILIFFLTPMVAAFTAKRNTYGMMIAGTFVMASPTFILALGPRFETLMAYLIIMSIGEAMWQPRFLQWVAEIAPKNMTGIYMGIGQFPWFLTKVVTAMYSGWFLMNYCPADAPRESLNTETMWLFYGFIAMISPIGLWLARSWMQKGFKTKHVA